MKIVLNFIKNPWLGWMEHKLFHTTLEYTFLTNKNSLKLDFSEFLFLF